MIETKEGLRFIDNIYTLNRIITALDKEPKGYNTEFKLYSNEVHTLRFIAEKEGITQTELSRKMFRTKAATSIMLSKLEKKGFIIRKTDEEDARVTRLYLTEVGKRVDRGHVAFDSEKVETWMWDIDYDPKELESANKVMETFAEYIEKNIL